MNKNVAQKLVNKTRDDYNRISHHFSSTRKYNWPALKGLLSDIEGGKNFKMADLGCGNGRIYELISEKKIDYYGLDLSEDLINIAKKKHPGVRFIVGNVLDTPYKDNFFDLTLSVATLHHIPGKESRRQALNEIYRITKSSGKVILTNWYFWDKPRYLKDIAKEAGRKLIGKSELDFGDFYMPWKSTHGNTITERYFHAWRKNEMKNELKRAGFHSIKILSSQDENSSGKIDNNMIVVCEK